MSVFAFGRASAPIAVSTTATAPIPSEPARAARPPAPRECDGEPVPAKKTQAGEQNGDRDARPRARLRQDIGEPAPGGQIVHQGNRGLPRRPGVWGMNEGVEARSAREGTGEDSRA